jgi:hypothetical protein
LIAVVALAAAPGTKAGGTCAGEACSAIAPGGDGCTFKNAGDKAIQLTTVADQSSMMMTVLAPGETIKQDKGLCEKFTRGEAHYDARFATLRAMPDSPDFTLKTAAAKTPPKPKPAPVVVAAAESTAVAAATPAAPAAVVAAGPALPRAKPAPPPIYPPLPRVKPVAPAIVAAAPEPATAVAPVAAVAPAAAVAPTAAVSPAAPLTECGEACATILFKVVDNCLWVVNMHPRAVAFQVEAGGQRMTMNLEAADGDKADAHAAAVAKASTAKDEAAIHMRLHDPFQSSGSGIPIFRARLGSASSCVKQRNDVTKFSARFLN